MNPGHIYYAVADDRAFLKLVGSIRYPLSQRLSLAVGRLFEKPHPRGVVVDLQEAEFIDSTCLGLLARVATQSLNATHEWPVILSREPEVNQLLCSMGFDRMFTLVQDPASPTAGLTDAEGLAGLARRPDPKLVLEAHRALSEINESNQHLFQNVIEQLESAILEESSRTPSQMRANPF